MASTTPEAPAEPCVTGEPVMGKSIGHTSVVFKLQLSNGLKVAWKPASKRGKNRYKGEIAAYRLGKALGIDNVPAVCFRAFDMTKAGEAVGREAQAKQLFTDEAIVDHGVVRGAVIPWIEGLQFLPLEKDPLRSEARQWLTTKAAIPEGKVETARQVSSLIAFDFLTTNWDRYSGENVGLDKAGTTVLYIDNDAAFMEGPPQEQLAKNQARLEATDRFSRSFVEHARKLDATMLTHAFGEEGPGEPLLAPATVEAVATRVKTLLLVVDKKIKAQGETETLFFP
jgi:hypothetical protein